MQDRFIKWVFENEEQWLTSDFQNEVIRILGVMIGRYGYQDWIMNTFNYVDALIIAKRNFIKEAKNA